MSLFTWTPLAKTKEAKELLKNFNERQESIFRGRQKAKVVYLAKTVNPLDGKRTTRLASIRLSGGDSSINKLAYYRRKGFEILGFFVPPFKRQDGVASTDAIDGEDPNAALLAELHSYASLTKAPAEPEPKGLEAEVEKLKKGKKDE